MGINNHLITNDWHPDVYGDQQMVHRQGCRIRPGGKGWDWKWVAGQVCTNQPFLGWYYKVHHILVDIILKPTIFWLISQNQPYLGQQYRFVPTNHILVDITKQYQPTKHNLSRSQNLIWSILKGRHWVSCPRCSVCPALSWTSMISWCIYDMGHICNKLHER